MDRKAKIIQFITNPLNILFIILQIFIISFLISSLINFGGSSKNKVTINESNEIVQSETDDASEFNVSQLSNLDIPKENITNIQRALFSVMTENNTSIKTTGLKTNIRNQKDQYFSKQKIHYQTFIVDIEDYKQSYRVTHEWSEEKDNQYLAPNDTVTVSCVYDKDKIKYKNFQCGDKFEIDPKYAILRHYAKMHDFGDFTVFEIEGKLTSFGIEMASSEQTEDVVTEKIKKWVKSMGYSPEGFSFSFYYGESWSEE